MFSQVLINVLEMSTVYAVTTTDEKSERPPFVERLMPTSQVVKGKAHQKQKSKAKSQGTRKTTFIF